MADLSPAAVAARLAELRALYVADDEEAARRRLEDAAAAGPTESFAEAVARRLAELRALDDLARHLHRARFVADGAPFATRK